MIQYGTIQHLIVHIADRHLARGNRQRAARLYKLAGEPIVEGPARRWV